MFVGCGCHCNPFESQSSRLPPSLSSLPPSSLSLGSSIVSDATGYQLATCTACRSGVASIAYEFDWDYNGEPSLDDPRDPKPCCATYRSIKKIRVIRRDVLNVDPIEAANYCWFQSREYAYMEFVDQQNNPFLPIFSCKSYDPTFTQRWFPLAEFQMNQFQFGEFAPFVRVNYQWTIRKFGKTLPEATSVFSALYRLVVPPGEQWIEQVQSGSGFQFRWRIPCLRPLTFALVPIRYSQNLQVTLGPGWQGTGFTQMLFPGKWIGSPCKQVLFSGFDLHLPPTITLNPVAE